MALWGLKLPLGAPLPPAAPWLDGAQQDSRLVRLSSMRVCRGPAVLWILELELYRQGKEEDAEGCRASACSHAAEAHKPAVLLRSVEQNAPVDSIPSLFANAEVPRPHVMVELLGSIYLRQAAEQQQQEQQQQEEQAEQQHEGR